VFWASHNPTTRVWNLQYKAAVFYHGKQQAVLAAESKQALADELRRAVATEILPQTRFYLAEDYHQKYWLRGKVVLFSEFQALYPDFNDLVNSTAAARVNGYLGRYGSVEQLQGEIDLFGLSESGVEFLTNLVAASGFRLDPLRNP